MVKQFVDHFKVKEYGFNFFPILGLIIATGLAQGLRVLYFAVEGLIRHGRADTYNFVPFFALSILLFGLCLVLLAHWINDDWIFCVVFALAYMIVSLISRLGYYAYFSSDEYFGQSVRLGNFLFDIRRLAGTLFYGLVIALALVLFFRLFQRLDYAALVAFPIAELLSIAFSAGMDVLGGGKPGLEFNWTFLAMVEGLLSGFFFYLGTVFYLKARGWRLSGPEVKPTGEETKPRTRLLSGRFFVGLISASLLVDLVLLYLILTLSRSGRMRFQISGGLFLGEGLGALLMILTVLAFVNIIFSAVVFVIFVLRMWTALQDGRARTSPGLAVGLLFVPAFNLFWLFQVFYGFARDHNALVNRHGLNVPKVPSGLYLTLSLLTLANALAAPLYGFTADLQVESLGFLFLCLLSVLQAAVALAVVSVTCQAVNRIPEEIYRRNPAVRATS